MVLTSVIGHLPGLFQQFDPFTTGFNFRDLIYNWEAIGVYDLFLPFLLIFAVMFAILSQTRVLGDHRGVNIIISLAIGLLSTRFPVVTQFFGVVFANFGIALAGLIVLLVMTGLFVSSKNMEAWTKLIYGAGVIGAVVVVVSAINGFSWFGSPWWQRNWTTVLWLIIGVLLIGFLMDFAKPKKPKEGDWGPLKPLRDSLFGGR